MPQEWGHLKSQLCKILVHEQSIYIRSCTFLYRVNKDVYGYCIYHDDEGQYYLSSDAERKFHTIKELVEAYADSPFQGKIRTTANVYFKHPIEKPKSLYRPDQVWKEFYDVKKKKSFYYNCITGVSSWNKPDTSIIDNPYQKKLNRKSTVSFIADPEFSLNEIIEESDEEGAFYS